MNELFNDLSQVGCDFLASENSLKKEIIRNALQNNSNIRAAYVENDLDVCMELVPGFLCLSVGFYSNLISLNSDVQILPERIESFVHSLLMAYQALLPMDGDKAIFEVLFGIDRIDRLLKKSLENCHE